MKILDCGQVLRFISGNGKPLALIQTTINVYWTVICLVLILISLQVNAKPASSSSSNVGNPGESPIVSTNSEVVQVLNSKDGYLSPEILPKKLVAKLDQIKSPFRFGERKPASFHSDLIKGYKAI